MSRLGIDRNSGLIYEGLGGPTHPVWPTPVVSYATLIRNQIDLERIPHTSSGSNFAWIFVETSYDPVSRVRRGRLYQSFGMVDREIVQVEAHPAVHSDLIKAANNRWKIGKELGVYVECTELLNLPNKGEGHQLAIGQRDAASFWRILQTERLASSDVLVTLRAESAFGILPKIDIRKIHPSYVGSVDSAYQRVLNTAYRELPTSVVDQCRNAVVVVISRWMQTQTNAETPKEQDLGDWIKALKNHFGDTNRTALRSALEVINRLHPRGKDNEKAKWNLRPVTEGDAELAVHTLAFVMLEIGWAAE